MGQIFRRLGSEVTVIEADPRVTGHENEAVSTAVTEARCFQSAAP
jgi:pyruvate/2-oxoglutarate dehydrogenase complex dihydrolipoamide dehydrogenase (E3) component